MNVRSLKPADLEATGALLYEVFARAAAKHGREPRWADAAQATAFLGQHHESDPDLLVVAEEGGAVVGVGAVRLRGEVATIGPIASYLDGRGIGGALVDDLLSRADAAGAAAVRLCVEGWNPSAYALYAGCGFGVVDVVADIERAPGPAPSLDSSRGLEVRPFEPGDLDELERLDNKLTNHERRRDLQDLVELVARRRGAIVGYLGVHRTRAATLLGPAIAVDVSDLFTLMTNALAAADRGSSWIASDVPQRARLSTAAPVASMAALGLGFRIRELGVVMSRGAPPPTRPPQLYSVVPEIL